MTTAPITVIPPGPGAWADPWLHPELFAGVTMRRVLAYGVDVVVVAVLAVMVWIVGSLLTVLSLGLLLPVKVLALALLPLAYHVVLLSSSASATLGMRLFGLRLVSLSPDAAAWGGRPTPFQAMIQVVAFYGSMALTGALILIVALFNARRRTLHDWLAGTVVVNDAAWRAGPA